MVVPSRQVAAAERTPPAQSCRRPYFHGSKDKAQLNPGSTSRRRDSAMAWHACKRPRCLSHTDNGTVCSKIQRTGVLIRDRAWTAAPTHGSDTTSTALCMQPSICTPPAEGGNRACTQVRRAVIDANRLPMPNSSNCLQRSRRLNYSLNVKRVVLLIEQAQHRTC